MKTRKLFLFLCLSVILIGCNQRASFDRDLLEGKWYNETKETENGESVTTKMLLTFHSDEVELNCKMIYEGLQFGRVKVSGTYSISGSSIKFNFDTKNLIVEVDRDFFDSQLEYKAAIAEFKEEFEKEGFGSEEVVSISDEELVLKDADGEETTFLRKS